MNSFYPVIMAENPLQLATFYQNHFQFVPVFENEWYVSLQREAGGKVFELALLRFDHETIPEGYRKKAQGFLLNVEVDNVAEWFERLQDQSIVLPLREEAFGQKHFILTDPEGNLVDVIENIQPSEEFKQHYTDF